MRSLRWFGLVSGLLFVGALGGLTAPLPSEAASLTIKIDTATPVNVGVSESCTTTQKGAHTKCFVIATGGIYTTNQSNGRQFTIQPYLSQTPLILVDDIPTTAGATDNLTASGMVVTPVASTWDPTSATTNNNGAGTTTSNGEQHVVELVFTHRFDFAPDSASTATSGIKYKFGVRASGVVKSLIGGNVTSDFVKIRGQGEFGSDTTRVDIANTTNPSPPTNTPPSPANGRTWRSVGPSGQEGSVTLNQITPFPEFACSNGASPPRCTPTVILTLTATLRGYEQMQLRNSIEVIRARTCDLNASNPEFRFPLLRKLICFIKGKKADAAITDELETADAIDVTDYTSTNTPTTEQCVDCPCSDPSCAGTGTIVIKQEVDSEVYATAGFEAIGAGIEDFTLTSNNLNTDSKTFSDIVAGEFGGSRTIKQTSISTHVSGDFTSDWDLAFAYCVSANQSSSWEQLFVSGELVGVSVINLGNDDMLTCTFHNHHTHGGDDHDFPHPPHPNIEG